MRTRLSAHADHRSPRRYLFREAAEALLTPYDGWISMMRSTSPGSPERTVGLAAAVEALSQEKRTALTLLLHHLHKVVDLREENKMAPPNIGVVFGPTLLRIGSEVSDIADIPVAAQIVAGLVEMTLSGDHPLVIPPPSDSAGSDRHSDASSIADSAADSTSSIPTEVSTTSTVRTAASGASAHRSSAASIADPGSPGSSMVPLRGDGPTAQEARVSTASAAMRGAIGEEEEIEPDGSMDPDEVTPGFNPVFNMPRESTYVEFDGFGNDAYFDIGEESDSSDDGDDAEEAARRKADAANGYMQLSFGDSSSSLSASGSPEPRGYSGARKAMPNRRRPKGQGAAGMGGAGQQVSTRDSVTDPCAHPEQLAPPAKGIQRSRPASVYGFGALQSDSDDDLC